MLYYLLFRFQANDPFSFDADSVTSALDKLLGMFLNGTR